jgi:toxin ParE1/3/4
MLIWHPQAREDLLEIYTLIGWENPIAAKRLFTAMEKKAKALKRYPRLGARRPDIRPSTRVLVEGAYLLLYETHPDTDEGPVEIIEIVRVVDGRRDLKRPF